MQIYGDNQGIGKVLAQAAICYAGDEILSIIEMQGEKTMPQKAQSIADIP